LAGKVWGLSTQAGSGAPQGDFEVEVGQFDLPTLRACRRDLAGWIAYVVEQGGQDPKPAGSRPTAGVGDGQRELRQTRDCIW